MCMQFLFKELEVSDCMYWVVTGALDVLGRDGKAITVKAITVSLKSLPHLVPSYEKY